MISAPHPTPSPTATPTPGGGTGASDTLSGIIHFILEHPTPFIIAAAWFGVLYLYNYKLRPAQQKKGRPIQPLGRNIRRTLKFALREDTGPVFTKPTKLAAKTSTYTWQRHYLTLVAATLLTHYLAPTAQYVLALILTATIAHRARTVFTTRHRTLMQMFAIAAAECKYPRDAAYNPWGWIQIQEWHDQTRPGMTAVSFPPGIYQAEDYKTREKFERNFNGTVSDEHMWTYKWESTNNRVILKPTPHLPTMAPYPGPGPKWNEIILGTAGEGEQAIWDVTTSPHALICGTTGSGKSVTQRMILFHCLVHADKWRIVGIDPKKVEMSWLEKYPNVLKICLSLEEGIEILVSVKEELTRRFDEMMNAGVQNFLDLADPPPALMLMIDETFNFLSPEGIKSEEGKERDALHAQGQALLGDIGRLGRAAGIFISAVTQRPDSTVIRGEFKANLDCRVACGRMDSIPSSMVLDSDAATRLPKVKGRGLIRLGGELTVFQGYFAQQDWFDKSLVAAQAAADGEGDDIEEAVVSPVRGVRGRLGGFNPLARVNAFVERKQLEAAAPVASPSEVERAGAGSVDVEPVGVGNVDGIPTGGAVGEVPVDDADLFSEELWDDQDLVELPESAMQELAVEEVLEATVPVTPMAVVAEDPAKGRTVSVPVPVLVVEPVLGVEPVEVDVPARQRGIPMVSFTPPQPPAVVPARTAPVVELEPARTAPAPAPVQAPTFSPVPALQPTPEPMPEPVPVQPPVAVPLVVRAPLPGTRRLPGTPARPAAVAAEPVTLAVEPVEAVESLAPELVPAAQGPSTWGPILDGNDWE